MAVIMFDIYLWIYICLRLPPLRSTSSNPALTSKKPPIKLTRPPQYNRNIVESGIKHHSTNPTTVLVRSTQFKYMYVIKFVSYLWQVFDFLYGGAPRGPWVESCFLNHNSSIHFCCTDSSLFMSHRGGLSFSIIIWRIGGGWPSQASFIRGAQKFFWRPCPAPWVSYTFPRCSSDMTCRQIVVL